MELFPYGLVAFNAKASGQDCCCGFFLSFFLFFTFSVICFKNLDLIRSFLKFKFYHGFLQRLNIGQCFLRMWLFTQRDCSGSLKILVQVFFN